MPLTLPSPSGPLAAIDMGSNSFRLEIGQMRDGRYRRHQYLKETVRLGAGLDADGMLTEEAALRGLACLKRFRDGLAGLGAAQVRAVATQTLREARNRNAFLERAQAALGVPIEVISGREEARLIYAGVSHLQPSDAKRLVIDIGGRSTEMILGQGRQPAQAESFQVGSVSLSMRYFPEGRYSASAFRAAQVAAGAELEEALADYTPNRWHEALGSSGTAGAVSEVLAASGKTDGRITPEGLRWLITECIAAGSVERIKLPGLKPERRAVLAGGVAILYTLATHFRIPELLPAKGALRQGVIIDLHDRLVAHHLARGHDLRDDSVQRLQHRFAVDREQARRVRDLALRWHGQIAPGADAERQHELRWAAELHEIGLMVSHHDHHRHSAYLVANVDAAGFSQSQQRRVAELVLGQRGGLRKIDDALAREDVAWQLLCLRLAVIQCHARGSVDPGAIDIERRGQTAYLRWPQGWADQHPRALHLLREEAEAWARSGALSLELP
ncbi:exopolyphosphatase [Ideonella sp.]|uniref:Ppx/GppA phosphatase family protein n=1 Tax=Ideonella sp. TaxID=1929293 RepID=UPI0035B3BFBF